MSNDPTETARREAVNVINAEPHDNRQEVEALHGQVWNTEELQRDFIVHGFAAPFIGVTRKSDGKKGALEFTHRPRWYFGWMEE